MDRPNQENLFTWGGRLFQQFLVDGYTMVETERLYFHRAKQSKLRCDTYSNIRHSIASGNTYPTALVMAGNNKRSRSVGKLVNKKKRAKKPSFQGESSNVNTLEKGKEQEEVFNIEEWYAEWCAERKKAARKASMLQNAKLDAEFRRTKPRVASVKKDADDDGVFSEEERSDPIDYDNLHLAFDPEKSPKINC
ncbi:hypothetical protein CTI12_AA111960 [Artemisia annua]|uniref:Helitron helicase-like domain-containing protein n=1 Tax=Artemisia annua TaxID=35608 RepID=A0A2U1PU94_ARTAN|nr:hypothetical protein CTI12_AA111960 [Artemisia annua]